MPIFFWPLFMTAIAAEAHRQWVIECDRVWSKTSRYGRG